MIWSDACGRDFRLQVVTGGLADASVYHPTLKEQCEMGVENSPEVL